MSEDIIVKVDDLSSDIVVGVSVPGPQGPAGQKGDKGDPGDSADLSNYYTKSEADTLLAAKADATHTHVYSDITNLSSAPVQGGTF